MFTVFLVIQVMITLALVGMILLQRSDADGLSGLGGGAGGGNSFMTGRAAANFMTKTTAILATAFMANSMWLALMSTDMGATQSIADKIAIEEDNPLNNPVPADAGEVEVPAPVQEQAPSVPTPE